MTLKSCRMDCEFILNCCRSFFVPAFSFFSPHLSSPFLPSFYYSWTPFCQDCFVFFPFLLVINGGRMCIDPGKLCLCWFQVAENGEEITQKGWPTVKEDILWFLEVLFFCCWLIFCCCCWGWWLFVFKVKLE